MLSDGLNSTLNPVVYGDIALSINTQYIHTIHTYIHSSAAILMECFNYKESYRTGSKQATHRIKLLTFIKHANQSVNSLNGNK